MVTAKRMLIAWGALSLLASRGWAAEKYYVQAPHRTVAIWRGEGAPEPPAAPRLAQNNRLDIAPVPDDEVDMPSDATAFGGAAALGGDSAAGCTGAGCSDPWAGGGCASGCAGAGGCSGACGGRCDSCCSPFGAHRSFVYGTSMYLRATGDNVAHAMLQNGVGGQGTTPNGRVGVVDSNYQTGFRVGFGVALDSCSSIVVGYANYFSHATDSLTADDGIGDTVASLVLHPNSTNAGSTSSFVQALHDIDFRTADIDYRYLVAGGCNRAVNASVGIRYGKLQQNFQQIGDFAQPVGQIQTNTAISFDGGGLRAGLDFERQVCCSQWSVYGKGFINVLFGTFNSSYTQVDNTSTIVQAASNWRDERVVPILEYEVGLSWTSRNGAWRSSTGYYTAFWFNAVTTSQYIQAVQTANFVNLGETVAFDGFISRLEYRF